MMLEDVTYSFLPHVHTHTHTGASVDFSVINVQAFDADPDTSLTYSYSGDSYPYGFFKINELSGLIQTARTLDNEVSSLVNLTVQASDGVNTVRGCGL